MSGYNVTQILEALRHQGQWLRGQLQIAEQLRAENVAAQQRVQQDWMTCGRELCEHLLPALDPAAVQRLQHTAGYDHLLRADAVGTRERERGQLQQWIRDNDAQPSWQSRERDKLRFEHRAREAAATLQTLEQPVAQYESLPLFEELIEVAYGTEEYAVPWWRVSYYRHWKHADMCCQLCNMDSFAEVRSDYLRQWQACSIMRDEQQTAIDGLQQLATAEKARRDAEDKLANLDAHHLREARAKLYEHLRSLDVRMLLAWNQDDRVCEALIKRFSGLDAKRRYLEALQTEQVDKPLAALREAITKNAKDLSKYARPKHFYMLMPAEQFQRRFRDRTASYRKRWERHWHARTTLMRFDGYSAYDPARELLWWDLMTDGRIDGRIIPEVQRYHHAHPDYQYQRGTTSRSSDLDELMPSLVEDRHNDDQDFADVS